MGIICNSPVGAHTKNIYNKKQSFKHLSEEQSSTAVRSDWTWQSDAREASSSPSTHTELPFCLEVHELRRGNKFDDLALTKDLSVAAAAYMNMNNNRGTDFEELQLDGFNYGMISNLNSNLNLNLNMQQQGLLLESSQFRASDLILNAQAPVYAAAAVNGCPSSNLELLLGSNITRFQKQEHIGMWSPGWDLQNMGLKMEDGGQGCRRSGKRTDLIHQETNEDTKRLKNSCSSQQQRGKSSSKRSGSQKREPALNTNLKPRAKQGCANDPQSIAARQRRERISERLKILQELIPNGSKVDLVTMLEKAINYVKFLQLQVKVLMNDEYWTKREEGVDEVVECQNMEM